MISFDEALRIANEQIASMPASVPLVLLTEHTIERPCGWVFFYTSQRYRDTGESRHAVGGNGPFIVDRNDGSVHQLGTAYPPEQFIDAYETLGRERYDAGEWRAYLRDRREK